MSVDVSEARKRNAEKQKNKVENMNRTILVETDTKSDESQKKAKAVVVDQQESKPEVTVKLIAGGSRVIVCRD